MKEWASIQVSGDMAEKEYIIFCDESEKRGARGDAAGKEKAPPHLHQYLTPNVRLWFGRDFPGTISQKRNRGVNGEGCH